MSLLRGWTVLKDDLILMHAGFFVLLFLFENCAARIMLFLLASAASNVFLLLNLILKLIFLN